MALSRRPVGTGGKVGTVDPHSRYSDLGDDEITVHHPSRWVVVALATVAAVMLLLAFLSSERVAAPRGPAPARGIAVDAATGAESDSRQLTVSP